MLMEPASKKSRLVIGSMSDAEVEDTNKNGYAEMGLSGSSSSSSDSDSDNSDTSDSDSSDDGETNNDSANNQEVRTRGHGKQGFEWGTGNVLLLSLDDDNHVVGNNAALFSSQLGILARDGNKLPLTYTDWRAVPHTQKDMAWEEVKENTNLTDSYKKNCLKKIGRVWKDWKNRVKAKHFKPDRHNLSVLLSKRPDRVEASQWPTLVNYWLSNKAKAISKKNKSSRKKIKLQVRLGRMDMPGAAYELSQEFGKKPSNSEVFIYSRMSRSKKKLDKQTQEAIDRLVEMKKLLPDHLKNDIDADNEIFEKVVGEVAPGCLSSIKKPSKGKNVVFTSREEFDEAVKQKANAEVASIKQDFQDEMTKFKNDCCSKMEILQDRLNTIENQNVHVPGSSNSRRILAPNNGSSSQDTGDDLETSQRNENFEMNREKTIPMEDNTNVVLNGTSEKSKGKKREPPRRSARKLAT